MKVLKIFGIVLGSFIGVFALIFFLYPNINPDVFSDWKDQEGSTEMANDTWTTGGLSDQGSFGEELQNLKNEIDRLQASNHDLLNTIDSLEIVNEDLKMQLSEWEQNEDLSMSSDPLQQGGMNQMDDEEFTERVKSLLNLDEDELAPIIRKMDDGQLVRLYRNAGNIQREKLLRSLDPQRAASLMSEVML